VVPVVKFWRWLADRLVPDRALRIEPLEWVTLRIVREVPPGWRRVTLDEFLGIEALAPTRSLPRRWREWASGSR
jgi:hypothetical protein